MSDLDLSNLIMPSPFAIRIEVSPEDIDAFSHANNAVYLKWLNECATVHSAAVGLPASECVRLDRGMAVRETKLLYRYPARLGDKLIVANWVTKNGGRLRASRAFQIVRDLDRKTLLLGASDYACIALSTGKPVRMPDIFKDSYQVDPRVNHLLSLDLDLRSKLII